MHIEKPGEYDIYSVSRLNREVKMTLEGSFPALWVKGEISNLATPASGHIYFSLKDENAQVRCAMFRGRNRQLKFTPDSGDEVMVLANISLYEGRGDYQLIVEQMEPAGVGALQKAFEQLKQKLLQEGLFDERHKKSLPKYPKTIGVLTSPTGAAIRDVLSVLQRRYPLAETIVYPTSVQGEAAIAELGSMMKTIIRRNEIDVLIITRGGGSLEDLFAFNDEALARAVHACPIPVVSAIGHEVDFTILDFVADVRAPTPSAAAELTCPELANIQQNLQSQTRKLIQLMANMHYEFTMRLEYLGQRLISRQQDLSSHKMKLKFLLHQLKSNHKNLLAQKLNTLQQLEGRVRNQNPVMRIALKRNEFDNLNQKLVFQQTTKIEHYKNILATQNKALKMASPLSILSRGYSVVKDPRGKIVQSVSQLSSQDKVDMILHDGEVSATVNSTRKSRLNDDST